MKSVIVGLAIASALAACAARGRAVINGSQHKNEITALWTQIRDWRREARMDVEPPAHLILSLRGKNVRALANAGCPDAHVPTPACTEICDLAGAICDNAEQICEIADELGGDPWAREKCDSAKASCNEAKQRCCDCDVEPAGASAEGAVF